MDIVTGHVGSAHVTSWQDRDLNQGIFGPDTYILNVGSKLAATIISNNEIRIADGTLVMQGCQGVIQKGTYDTISIDNGTQGLKRNDLICAQYTKSAGVESMSLVVIKGTAAATPVDPSYTSGDIQNGDTPVQVPIYRAVLDGLTLESVDLLVGIAGTMPEGGVDVYTGSVSNLASGSIKTLSTLSLSAGTYAITTIVQVTDTSISTLRCWISEGGRNYGSVMYTDNTYTNTSVTAVISSSSTFTVSAYARHNDTGYTVSGSYRIVCKKVG